MTDRDLMRALALTSTEGPFDRLIRELQNSSVDRVFRELNDSSAVKAAQLLQERIAADSRLSETARQLAEAAANLRPPSATIDVTNEIMNAHQNLLAAGALSRSLADAYDTFKGRHGLLSQTVLESLAGNLGEVTRASQWASVLTNGPATRLAAMFPVQSSIAEELERVARIAAGIASANEAVGQLRLGAVLGLDQRLTARMELTRFKLSALAGAGDVLGFQARASFAAYQEVFGSWHTRPDLPEHFWRDPDLRRHHYEEAQVDPGLIDSSAAAAVEVVIDSGFLPGVWEEGNSVALLEVGGVSMQIRSTDPRNDAFRALVAFEQKVRAFVAAKLEAAVGPKWFKQRVDGRMREKARANRATGFANGETEDSLVAYLDLGDLLTILLRTDNWDQCFGIVFPNRQRLEFDMQALVASRRPTVHMRQVDSVRLVELLCIIRRLSQFMDGDGEWKRIAESEE